MWRCRSIGAAIRTVPSTLRRSGIDKRGKLDFVRKYDSMRQQNYF